MKHHCQAVPHPLLFGVKNKEAYTLGLEFIPDSVEFRG